MKFIKYLIAIIIIAAIVRCVFKIKSTFSSIPNYENLKEGFNTLIENVVDTGAIQTTLSWKIDEAKWMAKEYYDDVLKDYVDKAKEWVSWAVENAKWYYNQKIDNLWNTITNEINEKVTEWLDKIKVK